MPDIDTDITSKALPGANDHARERGDHEHNHDLRPGTKEAAPGAGKTARQRWMALLARSDGDTLKAAWEALDDTPDYDILRPAEVGMVMVRARAGGTGRRFNLGEMTVCRCSVRTAENRVGHAYVAGRDRAHARYAALFDALLQDPLWHPRLERGLLRNIETSEARRRDEAQRKTATTKVDFFTLVRAGETADETSGKQIHGNDAHIEDTP